jgi:hypothetical protein
MWIKPNVRSSLNLTSVDSGTLRIILENQLWENMHGWLSPPDPSTNHNIARGTHHKKMATWFIECSILVKQAHTFRESKEVNLFWLHGRRAPV